MHCWALEILEIAFAVGHTSDPGTHVTANSQNHILTIYAGTLFSI